MPFDMYMSFSYGVLMPWLNVCLSYLREALFVCSFYFTGHSRASMRGAGSRYGFTHCFMVDLMSSRKPGDN